MAVLPSPPLLLAPLVSLLLLLLDDKPVFLRLAAKSSGSGELDGVFLSFVVLLSIEVEASEAMAPNELFAINVPFLGGRPILFPVLDILGPDDFVGLLGPSLGLLLGEKDLSDVLAILAWISILSGFP